MSWGYRKRVKVLPGVSLNVGKRSVGVSGGRRGARLSGNSAGNRSISLSWKSVFWRKKL